MFSYSNLCEVPATAPPVVPAPRVVRPSIALFAPPATATKGKRYGKRIVMGAGDVAVGSSGLPPASVAARSSLLPALSRGRTKMAGFGSKKSAARGPAPPPPAATPSSSETPASTITDADTHHVLEELLGSFSMHSAPTLYVSMLEEVEINFDSAPLESIDNDYGDDVEEVEEEVFNGSQTNGRSKRTVNYMEVKDIVLVKAWEGVTLDAMTGNYQTGKKYWRQIEDEFHRFMPEPSPR